MITKPMLACDLKGQWDKLVFPVYGTQKLDGIRSLKVAVRGVVSRTFKAIPNVDIRTTLDIILPNGADGEIIAGNFQETTHRVMSQDDKTPGWKYYMFDLVLEGLEMEPYIARLENLKKWYRNLDDKAKEVITLVLPTRLENKGEIEIFEQKCLDDGYEGVILRSGMSPYKCGRSTLNEGYLIKIKRFTDSEAVVEGFEEMKQNCNEATTNIFGRTERSSHKDNMVGKNTLGCLVARDIQTNIEIKIGSGFNDIQRKEVWDNKEKYLGQLAKYKFFAFGIKEKSRHPIFLGWRDKSDL